MSAIVIPAGIGHFYRSTNLAGLRIALWEDPHPALPLADHLREAGASLVPALGIAGLGGGAPDAAVLNLQSPDRAALDLLAQDVPFVIFTSTPERYLGLHPAGTCVEVSAGPEALASALLMQVAVCRSGLYCAPDLTVLDLVPKLRMMARILVPDRAHADDLVADAMEEAATVAPALGSDRDVNALLVSLIQRIWTRQKLSRLI